MLGKRTTPAAPPQDQEHKPLHEMPDGRGGELAARKAGEVITYDFGDDAGKGMENVDRSEMKLVWLDVLQSNSPQVEENDPKHMPGAKAGMFLDNMGNLYDGRRGVEFVPAYRDHNYVEFVPRNLGGGFQGFYPIGDDRVDAIIADVNKKRGKPAESQIFGKISTATKWSQDGLPLDGTEFTETFYLFGVFSPDDAAPFVGGVRFKSTQIGKYQGFVTKYRGFRYTTPKGPQEPPIWAHRWRLTTGPESNKKGKFYGVNIRLAELNEDGTEKDKSASLLRMDDPLYVSAKELHRSMSGGTVKADYAAQGAGDGGDDGAGTVDM